jgi:hypothetical protein
MFKNIPEGFTLYRGARRSHGYLTNNQSYFLFGNDGKNITRKNYTGNKKPGSQVYTYVTTRPLKLLNMGNPNNIVKLVQDAKNQERIIRSIKQSFRLENGIVYRFSESEEDLDVAKFICAAGYDGYYAPKLSKGTTGMFHQEIVLCKPRDKIALVESPLKRSLNNFSTPPGSPMGSPVTRSPMRSPVGSPGSPPPMKGKKMRQPRFFNN